MVHKTYSKLLFKKIYIKVEHGNQQNIGTWEVKSQIDYVK